MNRISSAIRAAMVLATPLAAAEIFSIDGPSPTYATFVANVHYPDSVLLPRPGGVFGEDIGGMGPLVNVSGTILPRHTFGPFGVRDVDAISTNHGTMANFPMGGYRIVFSVRRPDIADFGTGVDEQSLLNQEAGDMFISAHSFRPVLPGGAGIVLGPVNSNYCFRNQTDMDEVPSAPDTALVPAGTPIDNLDGFDFTNVNTDSDTALELGLYYSVSFATDADFGAYIFYLPPGWAAAPADPLDLGPIFATRTQLGLTSGDDIDALVVWDSDNDGVFEPGDGVIISLLAGSTSLGAGFPYNFGGDGSKGDVFQVVKTGPADINRVISRLAQHDDLGGSGGDYFDIDALEVLCPGDTNGDRRVDNADLQALLDAWGSSLGDATYNASVDFDGDGEIGNVDLQAILDNWSKTCPS
jgi:hypothetical protein